MAASHGSIVYSPHASCVLQTGEFVKIQHIKGQGYICAPGSRKWYFASIFAGIPSKVCSTQLLSGQQWPPAGMSAHSVRTAVRIQISSNYNTLWSVRAAQ